MASAEQTTNTDAAAEDEVRNVVLNDGQWHNYSLTLTASNDSITISIAFGGDPARRSWNSVRTVSNVFRFVS